MVKAYVFPVRANMDWTKPVCEYPHDGDLYFKEAETYAER